MTRTMRLPDGSAVPTWHGYPQRPDAHPDRPWWRAITTVITQTCGWERMDGHFVAHPDGWEQEWTCYQDCIDATTPALEDVDRTQPMPCPPPLCGQVWVFAAGPEIHSSVVMVTITSDDRRVKSSTGGEWTTWPPTRMRIGYGDDVGRLVAGPGAPWGPR